MSRLAIFLSLYFCFYGSAHLYILIKVRRAIYLHGWSYFLLFVVLTFLLLAPIQARLLEFQGYIISSLVITWIGFLWMGFLFVYLCLALPLDGYHLIVATAQRMFGADWTNWMLSRRQSLAIGAVAAGAIMLYGAFEARQIRVEKVTLPSVKIPESMGRVRIVQISDVHLGPMTYPGRMSSLVAAIRAARPDILVSSGDLVDGVILNKSYVAGTLRDLPAPMGKFAVTGNHEFYMGLDKALAFTRESGFIPLRGSSTTIGKALTITGVDDPAGKTASDNTEADLLAQVPSQHYSILLKHRPVVPATSRGRFDLQLSGHTHKGQIFPFGLLVSFFYPLRHGLHLLDSRSRLYTSRGSGTWGPPVRVLTPPEITIIDLVHRKDPKKEKNRNNQAETDCFSFWASCFSFNKVW